MEAGLSLFPTQIEDLSKFIQFPRFLNRSECGTGKTPVSCVYTEYEVNHNKNTVVWIQPSSLLNKNAKEILKWCELTWDNLGLIEGTKKKKIDICNNRNKKVFFITADSWASEYGDLIRKNFNPKVLICDEPQMYYRGWESKRTQKFISTLKPDMKVKFMTATPTPHGNLSAAYVYCHVLQQDYYKHYKYFKQIHAMYDDFGQIIGWENHDTLKKLLDYYSVTRTSKEIYGDQEKHIFRRLIEMLPEQRKIYNEFVGTGMAELQESIIHDNNKEGQTTLRLRQVMQSPHEIRLPCEWDDAGKPIKYDVVNVIPNMDKLTPKEEEILAYLQEGEPIAIFGVFENELQHIHYVLTKAGFKGALINGSVSGEKRAKIDADFQAGLYDYVVCSIKTAAVGFNWGFLNTIVFHSMDYGDDDFVQACHRAIRGKRSRPLRVIILEYYDSIEPIILWKVHHKSKHTNKINPNLEVINFPNIDDSVVSSLFK